jgi:hypothetical protein
MRAQKVGGGLLFLMGLVLLLCIIAFALGTMAQGEEALETLWIIFIGLPLVAVFFPTAWALWTSRRVRPVLGGGSLMAALMYSVLLAGLTIYISWWVRQSPSLLAGIAFIALLPFWPVVMFLMLLAWWLLRRPGAAFASWGFIGIALAWLVAFVGLLVILPDEGPIVWWRELLTRPEETLPVLAFFLTPAVLALGLAGTRWGSHR